MAPISFSPFSNKGDIIEVLCSNIGQYFSYNIKNMPRVSKKSLEEIDEDYEKPALLRRSRAEKCYVRWSDEENQEYALFL